jgi:3-isopropylmalate/(R)-2-methylmalate dehydratase large subunit
VLAKDIMLALCGRLGMDGGQYQAVEYTGEAIAALSMQERMTLSNMAAELGGQAGLIAPDETTAAYLENVGGSAGDSWRGLMTDPGAPSLQRTSRPSMPPHWSRRWRHRIHRPTRCR